MTPFSQNSGGIWCWRVFVQMLLTVAGLESEFQNTDRLQLAQILFRHGDRTQIFAYPLLSPFLGDESGTLTDVGKNQMYNLGIFLRKRYNVYFIITSYLPGQIQVISSDFERTIESAKMVLTGFYRLSNATTELNPLANSIQEIPIRLIQRNQDNLIKLTKYCPTLVRLLDKLRKSDLAMQMNGENQDLISYENKNVGTNASNVFDIAYIGDILNVKEAHNEKLDEWEETVFTKMQELYDMTMKLETSTTQLKRLKSGPLLKLLLQNFQNVSSSSSSRLILYSGHDDIMVSIRNSLSINDSSSTPYAAALIFELYKSEADNAEYVEIFYRHETGRAPFRLVVPNCGTPCFLHRLFHLVKPVIPENWERECFEPNLQYHLASNGESSNPTSSQGYAALESLRLLAVGAILTIYFIRLRYNASPYESL